MRIHVITASLIILRRQEQIVEEFVLGNALRERVVT
jgi:hypothetical protein